MLQGKRSFTKTWSSSEDLPRRRTLQFATLYNSVACVCVFMCMRACVKVWSFVVLQVKK